MRLWSGSCKSKSSHRVSQVREESLEVLGEKWSCRCGFIGDTAEEVWEHQQDEMRECEESECSGRMDECDHCPEIATGDAQREPLVSIHDVRDRLKAVVESAHKAPVDDVGQKIVEEVYELIDELEEFTQNGGSAE